MRQPRCVGVILFIALLVGGLLALAWPADAQQQPGGVCDELQVVFVVDQSLSMSAKVQGAPASDPEGLRFYGPKYAVETLSAMHYNVYMTDTIQVAVVYFGDTPSVQLPWTSLEAVNDVEHEKAMAQLAPSFEPVKNRGNTNVLKPFQTASSLFNQIKAQANGCPARGVIVITDGRPSLLDKNFIWTEHMEELIQYAQQYMPTPDHQIYVIGIDKADNYWNDVKPYWDRVTGSPERVVKAQNQQHMASLIVDIIDKMTKSLGTEGPNIECVPGRDFPVPPFLQEIRLTLIKPSPDLHLDVVDESAKKLESSRTDVSVTVKGFDEPIETLIVSTPRPGIWQVQTLLPPDAENRCLIRKISFKAVGELVSPDPKASNPPIQFKRMPVVFRVVETGGGSLPNYADPKYELDLAASLVGPSQISQSLALSRGAGYEYSGEAIPLEAGENAIHLSAKSHNPDGSEYKVFEEATTSFQVTPIRLVMTEGPTGVVKQYSEVPLTFATVVTEQQPILLDLPTTFTATLTYQEVVTPVAMSAAQDGTYQGLLHPVHEGKYTLDYQATVDTPDGRVLLSKEQLTFDVFPTTMVKAEIVKPFDERFTATDVILQPTGLVVEVQIVDENGKEVGPGEVGAANPMAVFDIKVLDKDHNDLSDKFSLTNTGKPGLFRLEGAELGAGQYEVTVLPATTLGSDYVWADKSWSRTFQGEINRLFFALLAAAAGAIGLLIMFARGEIKARRHPLSGYIEVFREIPQQVFDGETLDAENATYRKTIVKTQLPRDRNKKVIRVGGGGGAAGAGALKRIIVTCPSEADSKAGIAHARVEYKSGGESNATLSPEAAPTSLKMGFFIEKGPRKVIDTTDFPPDFDMPEGRQ